MEGIGGRRAGAQADRGLAGSRPGCCTRAGRAARLQPLREHAPHQRFLARQQRRARAAAQPAARAGRRRQGRRREPAAGRQRAQRGLCLRLVRLRPQRGHQRQRGRQLGRRARRRGRGLAGRRRRVGAALVGGRGGAAGRRGARGGQVGVPRGEQRAGGLGDRGRAVGQPAPHQQRRLRLPARAARDARSRRAPVRRHSRTGRPPSGALRRQPLLGHAARITATAGHVPRTHGAGGGSGGAARWART